MSLPIHFDVSGSGDIPLVCIHGWGCRGDQFNELSQRLSKDFRIFRVDLPGHGRTPLGDFLPGFTAYADCLVEFLRLHGLERAVLCGHSIGGVLSLMAAASDRIRPAAIINLDGSLPATEETLTGQRKIRRWLDKPDFRKLLARLLARVFFLPSERDARCEAILRTMCSAPPPVLRFLPEQVDDLRPEQILPLVACPALFVGSSSARFDAEKAAALLPRIRLEHIPNAGHFLHVYAADQVAALLKNFLAAEVNPKKFAH
jgi:pimeloyl-ACP methyl ester carboxylesterase